MNNQFSFEKKYYFQACKLHHRSTRSSPVRDVDYESAFIRSRSKVKRLQKITIRIVIEGAVENISSKRRTLRNAEFFNIASHYLFNYQASITLVITLKFCDNAHRWCLISFLCAIFYASNYLDARTLLSRDVIDIAFSLSFEITASSIVFWVCIWSLFVCFEPVDDNLSLTINCLSLFAANFNFF